MRKYLKCPWFPLLLHCLLFHSLHLWLPSVRLVILDHFYHGRGNVLFLLELIYILCINFPSLHAMLLPKILYVYLQNVLSAILVLHPTLLLINELTSQQMRNGNGPSLMEFTGFTILLTILKQWV